MNEQIPEEKKKKKEAMIWLIISIVLGVVIAITALLQIGNTTTEQCNEMSGDICLDLDSKYCGCDLNTHTCPSDTRQLCNLAKCIVQKNLTLYYLPTCVHCQNTLNSLKPFDNSFNKVDCSKNYCPIDSVPTWTDKDNNVVQAGYVSPEQLFQKFGCQNLDLN